MTSNVSDVTRVRRPGIPRRYDRAKTLVCLIFALLLLVSAHAWAQTGTISGMVVDQISQEPLPFANVQVLGTALGASADVDGKFSIRDVTFGTYQLRASLVGYQQRILSDVVVAAGRVVQIIFKLDEVPVGIGAVEVTAGYFQKNPDAPVSTQRLSAEEIRRSPGGFEDVLRAIAVLPGVAQVDAGRNDLVVRGGSPSENLYVVDNLEIPNINHFGTQGSGGGPLSFINLDFVRETSFSTGGFGVKYGGRLSSVLNVEMRDGRNDRLGGKGTISASQFGLNVEGPVDANGTFLLSARRSYLDFIFKAAGFNFVPEYWDFLGRLTYRLDQRNMISFLGIGAIDDVSFFNDDAEKRYENSRILGTAQKQYAGGVGWDHQFGRAFLNVTLGRTFVRYTGVQSDSLLRPIFTNASEEGETSLRADMVMKIAATGEDEVSFGIQGKRLGFSGAFALPQFVTSFGDTLAVSMRGTESIGLIGSAYGQFLHHWTPHLQLVLGVRVDYFDRVTRNFAWSPRASATWQLSTQTSVSASAGIYHQFPALIWLLADPENRELSAARAYQYILSVEHLLRDDLRVRMEVFLKEYRGYPASVDRPYLVLANVGGGYGGSEENFATYGLDRLVSEGRGRSRGMELLVQKKLSDIPIYGIFGLTWGWTDFTALDGIERPGAFDQRLLLTLSGGYRFDERWEGSMRFRYASGRPYTPFNGDGTQTVASLYGGRLDAFHALDLRVDRRWNFEAWNLIVYLDIQNVYNNKYSSAFRWNAREQRVEENRANIGILPSLGVSAEF